MRFTLLSNQQNTNNSLFIYYISNIKIFAKIECENYLKFKDAFKNVLFKFFTKFFHDKNIRSSTLDNLPLLSEWFWNNFTILH
jgi:hypothetical protein